MVVIGPGERHTTKEDIVISTVLGSCVAVTCFDLKNRFGGMNHFMLPGDDLDTYSMGITGKYGIHAMELLFEDMRKLGSRFEDIEVKIFGGGAVLKLQGEGSNKVPADNIQFALRILQTKYRRPVTASDIGGIYGRKVLFLPKYGTVKVKLLGEGGVTPVIEKEQQLIKELHKAQK